MRQFFGKGNDAALGCGVVRVGEIAGDPGTGTDVHDFPLFFCPHDRQHRHGKAEHAVQVQLDQAHPFLLIDGIHSYAAAAAGRIIHQNIHSAKFLHRRVHDLLNVLILAHVAVKPQAYAACQRDLIGGVPDAFRFNVARNDICAEPRQFLRNAATDAVARACHNGGFPGQLKIMLHICVDPVLIHSISSAP